MDRYIGMDVHMTSCTIAVVGPSGRRLGSQVVETNGQAVVEAIRAIPQPRHLCMEEGTQSAWLYEVLSPHVQELVVAGITESRGPKSDTRDAFGLAEALRLGAITTPVFKAPSRFALLRELGRTYSMLARDVVRTQNRLKTLYRSRHVAVPGKGVYRPTGRDEFLMKLPAPARSAATLLYAELDALREVKREAHKQLVAESHRHPISHVLEACPGLGEIRVAPMTPVVISPERFRTSRQFWSYCGLGIVMRSSSDWVRDDGRWVRSQVAKTRGLNRRHNATLKVIFKDAAMTVVMSNPDEPLHKDYDRLLAQGTKPNLAKLTLARKIAATALVMWKRQEVYDPTRYRKQ
jgi:transposase